MGGRLIDLGKLSRIVDGTYIYSDLTVNNAISNELNKELNKGDGGEEIGISGPSYPFWQPAAHLSGRSDILPLLGHWHNSKH